MCNDFPIHTSITRSAAPYGASERIYVTLNDLGAQHFDCLQDAVLKSLLSHIESI